MVSMAPGGPTRLLRGGARASNVNQGQSTPLCPLALGSTRHDDHAVWALLGYLRCQWHAGLYLPVQEGRTGSGQEITGTGEGGSVGGEQARDSPYPWLV